MDLEGKARERRFEVRGPRFIDVQRCAVPRGPSSSKRQLVIHIATFASSDTRTDYFSIGGSIERPGLSPLSVTPQRCGERLRKGCERLTVSPHVMMLKECTS